MWARCVDASPTLGGPARSLGRAHRGPPVARSAKFRENLKYFEGGARAARWELYFNVIEHAISCVYDVWVL